MKNAYRLILSNSFFSLLFFGIFLAGCKQKVEPAKVDPAFDAFMQGLLYADDNSNLGEAIKSFDKAIELKPDFARAYVHRGVVKTYTGDKTGGLLDVGKAIVLSGKAIEAKPDDAEAYEIRGLAESYFDDQSAALLDLNKAIELSDKALKLNSLDDNADFVHGQAVEDEKRMKSNGTLFKR